MPQAAPSIAHDFDEDYSDRKAGPLLARAELARMLAQKKWIAVPELWQKYRWGVAYGFLFTGGLLAADPFNKDSDEPEEIVISGTQALETSFTEEFQEAAENLNIPIVGTPHSVITYFSDAPVAPGHVFIVPSRWQFGKHSETLPVLLEIGAHRERILETGADYLAERWGDDFAHDLLSLAYGEDAHNFAVVTALEYTSHSFGHHAWQDLDSPARIAKLQSAKDRALEDHKADVTGTALVAEAFGTEAAISTMAAQIAVRLGYDLTPEEDNIESSAHYLAAEAVLAEFMKIAGEGGETPLADVLREMLSQRLEQVRQWSSRKND